MGKRVILFYWLCAIACCNIIFFYKAESKSLAQRNLTSATETEIKKTALETLLNKSLNLDQKNKELESEASLSWLGFIPGYSPWETQLNISFERQWSDLDVNTQNTKYQTYNLITRFQQRTPLGLTLDVNFEKLIDLPEIDGFFMTESVSANLYLSLLNDFMGYNTKKILNAIDTKNKKTFEDRTLIEACQKISNQFFDAFLNEQNLKILKESVDDINFINSRISKDAISRQNSLSLNMDRVQLLNRSIKANQQFQMSQLLLSDLSRIKADELIDLKLNENIDNLLKIQNEQFAILDRLNLEIEILEARKKLLQLNQRNDISVYAGLRTSETLIRNSPASPLDNSSNSNVIGLNFNWNFSNMQIENSKKSIEFEIMKRKIQKDHITNQKNQILSRFKSNIEEQVKTLSNLKESIKYADELQEISVKNFLNGRIGFFEYITSRNQVNSIKNDYNQALVDFYKLHIEQSAYMGNVDQVCLVNYPKSENAVVQN